MPDSCPWARRADESDRSHIRFVHYLHQGPGRSLAQTARAFGVTRQTIYEASQRFDWVARARAWDESPEARRADPSAQLQVLASEALTRPAADEESPEEADHLAALEDFREAAEALSRDQVRLGRAATAAAGRGLATLMKSGRELSARDIAALAGIGAQLATAGLAGWAKSIGVDALLARLEQAERLAAEVVEVS